MSTPQLQLETLFRLNEGGRIISTREPGANRGPLFSLIRGKASCAWATGADVQGDLALQLERLAQTEPPLASFRDPPLHAEQYLSLLQTGFTSLHSANADANADANANAKLVCFHGPAFTFPETDVALPRGPVAAVVNDESVLHRHFRGWAPGEIAAGRAPVLALLEDGHAISICFCARRSDAAAEAGLETAPAYRRRGFAKRMTAAWARAVRESGRVPLYSTSWTNVESLAVARELGLTLYASDWSVSD